MMQEAICFEKDDFRKDYFKEYRRALLLLLLIFSFFIRVYDIAETPLGMHADEVSGAYNAYSILKTGRDEHGTFLPLYFEAFNDYKHPVLLYSMVPSLALFDLTPFGTRLPSVLFSVAGILCFYYIVKELFNLRIAFLSGFLLSIMPWYFHYSRVAFEVMSFCFLFLLGLLFFLYGFKNKKWWFAASIVFGISLYAYGIARLFVPLFLLGCLWIYKETLFPHRKTVLFCMLIFLIVVTPAYYASFFGNANARFAVVSVFERSETPFASFFVNYFSHFSPEYLFFSGDAQIVNAVTNWGQLYHFAVLFLPLGVFFCWKQRKEKHIQLLFLWLILYPLAPSFTYGDLPHAARSFVGVPLFSIFIAYGITQFHSIVIRKTEDRKTEDKYGKRQEGKKEEVKSYMNKKGIFIVFFIFINVIILFEATFFFHDYFFVYKERSADYWLAFATPTVAYLEEIKPAYEHVYLSKTGLDLFYISLLYHSKADPAVYHEKGLPAFGYEICDFDTCFNESQNNAYVFRGFEVTINGTHNIYYHNSDKIAIKIFETQ